MTPRAIWKGYLRLSLVNCAVELFPAVTEVNKTHFHKLNRETGHRLRMRMVDEETGEEVPAEDQVKGYEIRKGETVQVEDEELDTIALEVSHVMEITEFVPREEIDPLYFERPYFLAPGDDASQEAFAVLREAMRRKKIGALATLIMHERDHIVLVEPRDKGMTATVLRSPEELRDAKEIFAGIKNKKITGELVDVAEMLIERKMGKFDPAKFKDRYEEALKALLKAKHAGRKIKAPKSPPMPATPSSILDALKKSLAESGGRAHPRRQRGARAHARRSSRHRARHTAKKRA
ncbi:MAG TPA: Ku protein [Xanthobacteraceae bacterium]|nr:Ku protein [Xanthobacteraceae bacterium]